MSTLPECTRKYQTDSTISLSGKKAFDGMDDVKADVTATDCPLAAVQFEQALGSRPIHPIQILAKAYRPDGFPNRLPQPEENDKE